MIADPLSRLCQQGEGERDSEAKKLCALVEESTPEAVQMEEIREGTSGDPILAEILECLSKGEWPISPASEPYKHFKNELANVNGVLIRGHRIVIPTALRERVLEAAHEGHPGSTKMTQRLRSHVWWPKMDKDVEKKVSECSACQIVARYDPPEPIIRTELPSGPWQYVAIDLI